MKKLYISSSMLLVFVSIFFSSCLFGFPNEHTPPSEIHEVEVENYEIAYCWQDPNGKQSIISDEDKEVVIVVSDIKGIYKKVIQSQYNNEPNASNMVIFKNGCLSVDTAVFKQGWYSLAWRPNSNEIIFAEGTDWSLSHFNSKLISNMEIKEGEFKDWIYDSRGYFSIPRGIYWSNDGSKFATLGRDIMPLGTIGDNIWVASGNPPSYTRITNIMEVGDFIANASWSSDNTKLAITYRKNSGIAIVTLDNQNQVESYINVTKKEFSELSEYWPFVFTSFLQLISDLKHSGFSSYVSVNSIPVWINNDQQIIFAASSSSDQSTLFIVDSDGTNLEPFLPDVSGLIFMPRLSANGRTLAFVRYPNWKTRDKVEIATVDIYTKEISSLVVLYSQTEEDLIISGMNWSPDGKYLMFSSNHAGESDIYIITADGSAWKNITEDIDGNAVGPIWKP